MGTIASISLLTAAASQTRILIVGWLQLLATGAFICLFTPAIARQAGIQSAVFFGSD